MSVECTLPSRLRDGHSLGRALLGVRGLLALLGVAAAGVAVARLCTRRVVVDGRSMSPAFEPGDRLVVVRLPRRWPVRPDDVVALSDPRRPDRLLVKRVTQAHAGRVTVAGDNASESTDSRDFGPVERSAVWGRVVYRYAPPGRTGRTGGAGGPRWGRSGQDGRVKPRPPARLSSAGAGAASA
jgi:nickel-type superoxide dismutase maturation protease